MHLVGLIIRNSVNTFLFFVGFYRYLRLYIVNYSINDTFESIRKEAAVA